MAKREFKSVKEAEKDILGTKKPESIRDELKKDIVGGVVDYIVRDVVMPNSKTLLYETIRGVLNGIDQMVQQVIFGETRFQNFVGQPQTQTSYISYDAMWNRNGRQTIGTNQSFSKPNLRLSVRELTFVTKHEAEYILDTMVSYLEERSVVTVNDLCAILQIPGSYTDVRYGWRSMNGCLVEQTPRGWYLNLTNPVVLRSGLM